MTLVNRVAPDGRLHADPAHGLYTGNRGIIHDPETRLPLGRKWSTKSWIICLLEWNGRGRDVWGRNGPKGGPGWSELFFLDDVTALAAGHRPCFSCRRERARLFAASFHNANSMEAGSVRQIDDRLHKERCLSSPDPSPELSSDELAGLPDGVMLRAGGQFLALRGQTVMPWGFAGYGEAMPLAGLQLQAAQLITPVSTVGALREGYQPDWHASATA